VQVHGQRLAAAGAALQHGLAQEHEAHAGHAFQAFAAGGDERVEADLAGVDLAGAEGAHGVDDQALAVGSQTSATSCSGFSTPAPVSQWISMTWVMLVSASSMASTRGG
jgi:hypothetical protein